VTTVFAERVAVLLEGAADFLDFHGWIQGVGIARGGAHCVNAAINGWPDMEIVRHGARVALADFLGVRPGDVGLWNDTPGRTKAEVVNALRSAAIVVRNGEVYVDDPWRWLAVA
jgi:hypothetical protein